MRVFIAIDVSEEIKNYLKELQKEIKDFDPNAKLTYPNDFHITLKFLGEVDDSKTEQIKNLLEKASFIPFSLKLSNPGYFDDKLLRVAWVGIDDSKENIADLQKGIDKQLIYFFPKEKSFKPHFTLARIRSVENPETYKEHIKNLKIEQKEFKADSFKLIKSTLTKEGPVYEVLKEYKGI